MIKERALPRSIDHVPQRHHVGKVDLAVGVDVAAAEAGKLVYEGRKVSEVSCILRVGSVEPEDVDAGGIDLMRPKGMGNE